MTLEQFLQASDLELLFLVGKTSQDFPNYNFEADFLSSFPVALSATEAIIEHFGSTVRFDFDKAAYLIKQDGSILAQNGSGTWGLYDWGDSPDNPVVPYRFSHPNQLIIWYFSDMGWQLPLIN